MATHQGSAASADATPATPAPATPAVPQPGGRVTISAAAARLAAAVLGAFNQNGSYADYREADGWTDDQYAAALAELEAAAGPAGWTSADTSVDDPPAAFELPAHTPAEWAAAARVGTRIETTRDEAYDGDDGEPRVLPAGSVGTIVGEPGGAITPAGGVPATGGGRFAVDFPGAGALLFYSAHELSIDARQPADAPPAAGMQAGQPAGR